MPLTVTQFCMQDNTLLSCVDDDDENTGGEEFLIKRNVLLSYDGADYSMNQPGLNILVYDNQHMVGVDACVLSEGSSLNRR